MVVPEKRRYLAQNSMKRDPKAPRGARFPVRSSKRIRSPTLDDNGSQGRLTPVLPPGPFADQPLPGPSQLPLSGSFSRFSSTPWTNSWVPPDPQSYPPSGTNGFIPQGLSRLISNIHVIDTASDGVPMQTFNPDNRGDIPPPLQSLQAQLQDSSDHYMGAFTAAPPGTFQTSPSTAYHQFMLNSTGMSEGQYGRPPPDPTITNIRLVNARTMSGVQKHLSKVPLGRVTTFEFATRFANSFIAVHTDTPPVLYGPRTRNVRVPHPIVFFPLAFPAFEIRAAYLNSLTSHLVSLLLFSIFLRSSHPSGGPNLRTLSLYKSMQFTVHAAQ